MEDPLPRNNLFADLAPYIGGGPASYAGLPAPGGCASSSSRHRACGGGGTSGSGGSLGQAYLMTPKR